MKTGNIMIGSIGAMSLKKYVSQDVPSRDARVKLLKSQVKVSKYFDGVRSVTIKKFPQYSYLQKNNDYALYTDNGKGDPDRTTAFLVDYK
jgi:hypothetical protein